MSCIIFTRANETAYGVRSGARWTGPSCPAGALRLPGGVQFFLDIFAITYFSLAVSAWASWSGRNYGLLHKHARLPNHDRLSVASSVWSARHGANKSRATADRPP
jgi:hypothetical protein